MVYGLWQSAAGLQAEQYRQAIIANNLANVETPGFKPERIAFAERLIAAVGGRSLRDRHPVLDALNGGLVETPIHTDFAQAGLNVTNNPFDVAILGHGFLAVQTPEGTRYTRDGRLVMDQDGTLRHAASGGAVLAASGRTVSVDPASREPVAIDSRGRVRQGETLVAQLAVFDFEDRQALEKVGANLMSGDRANRVDATGTVRQGAYEESGVDPMKSLVEMIAATRAFEQNARLISLQDETLGRTVNELGRIG